MQKPFQSAYGFHLVELLVVISIISIVSAFSVPLYSQYMAHERRNEAVAMMGKLALALEAFHVEHDTYQGATLAELNFPEAIVRDHYQLSIRSVTDQTYLVAAVPVSKAEKDGACGVLTLDSQGEKSISGTGSVEECW